MNEERSRRERCKFCLVAPELNSGKIKYKCVKNGLADPCTVSSKECDECDNFKSRYIEYPIEVGAINSTFSEKTRGLHAEKIGKFVAVRPCDDECHGKTYLGIFLGDLAHDALISYHTDTKILDVMPIENPAMFVPELNRVVFGYESWWHVISAPEELKSISDEDIQSQWYVKAAKEMLCISERQK